MNSILPGTEHVVGLWSPDHSSSSKLTTQAYLLLQHCWSASSPSRRTCHTSIATTLSCVDWTDTHHWILETLRIIEQLGLEGSLESHLVQTSCNEQGHLPHLWATPGCSEPWPAHLECFQRQGIYLSGQKNFFLVCSLNLFSLGLKLMPLVLSQQDLLKSLSPSFS